MNNYEEDYITKQLITINTEIKCIIDSHYKDIRGIEFVSGTRNITFHLRFFF